MLVDRHNLMPIFVIPFPQTKQKGIQNQSPNQTYSEITFKILMKINIIIYHFSVMIILYPRHFDAVFFCILFSVSEIWYQTVMGPEIWIRIRFHNRSGFPSLVSNDNFCDESSRPLICMQKVSFFVNLLKIMVTCIKMQKNNNKYRFNSYLLIFI